MINIASAKGFAPTYKLEVADTIVDFNGTPHRMIKMRITGAKFEYMDTGMFVRTRNGLNTEDSFMANIAENDQAVHAFFPLDFMHGDVEFGYGGVIIGVFKRAKWERIPRLKDELIDKGVTAVTQQWLKQKREARKRGM